MAKFDRQKKVDAMDAQISIVDFSTEVPTMCKEVLTLIGNPSERNYMLGKALEALNNPNKVARFDGYISDVYSYVINYNLLQIFPVETLYTGTTES